jgi:cytochrome c oxidase assembly protein subunit 15
LYRASPEYQKKNYGMSLSEFKNIFFWEWFHRLWGRLIGLVYALPLFFFWIKGWIPQGYKKPLLALLFLGGLQGVIGYIMVLSGLAERPSVSHYKLALHLSLAWIVFCALVWLAFTLTRFDDKPTSFCRRRHGWSSLALLFITLVWGAFMAGTDAGLVSQSWPHMHDGQVLPDSDLSFYALFANSEWIHFIHRWIAAVTLIMIFAFAWRVKSPLLGAFVFIQFGLGIWTVASGVSIHVAASHQAGAFILTLLLLREIYKIKT